MTAIVANTLAELQRKIDWHRQVAPKLCKFFGPESSSCGVRFVAPFCANKPSDPAADLGELQRSLGELEGAVLRKQRTVSDYLGLLGRLARLVNPQIRGANPFARAGVLTMKYADGLELALLRVRDLQDKMRATSEFAEGLILMYVDEFSAESDKYDLSRLSPTPIELPGPMVISINSRKIGVVLDDELVEPGRVLRHGKVRAWGFTKDTNSRIVNVSTRVGARDTLLLQTEAGEIQLRKYCKGNQVIDASSTRCACPDALPRWNAPSQQCVPCEAGTVWNGTKCVRGCDPGMMWDGAKCVHVCESGTAWDGSQCASVCEAGTAWDGTKCVRRCPAGTEWDGGKCASLLKIQRN